MPTSCAEDGGPRVLAVHPACAVWPANILRIHVVFDRAMDRDGALGRMRIETEAGAPVPGALVDMPDGLWTADQRVLTILLHPARVKRGLGEHSRRGRALETGRGYALVVGGCMADAEGRPLGRDHRAPFVVGPPVKRAVDASRWRVPKPPAGSADPLVIETDHPLDALGVARGLRLRDASGPCAPARFDAAGCKVVATPLGPWPEGPLGLELAADLEDVCGNRPTDPFERSIPVTRAV